ncbi:hypothetical protein OC845_006965, partial [Tilletia horrida]
RRGDLRYQAAGEDVRTVEDAERVPTGGQCASEGLAGPLAQSVAAQMDLFQAFNSCQLLAVRLGILRSVELEILA